MSDDYHCPSCGEESERPEMEEVTGGVKLTCPECGATDFQPGPHSLHTKDNA